MNNLYALRSRAGLSQQEVADRLAEAAARQGRRGVGVSANTVSRWERGIVVPTPLYRRLLAETFGVTVSALGLSTDRAQRHTPVSSREDPLQQVQMDDEADPRVRRDQEDWRRTRRALNAQRPELARLAAQMYAPSFRVADTGLITRPGWLPAQPVDLGDIRLTYVEDSSDPMLDGTEPETVHVRPRVSLARHYPRYSQAIRDLDRPRLFENRISWRLTDVTWSPSKCAMTFGPGTYFAGVDTYEALAHELAYLALDEHGMLGRNEPAMRDLPFRHLIGDPFDLARRPVLPSIDTLTIRRESGEASFILHQRDPRSVAVAGGMLQVIPSGVFQPSSILPGAAEADFDLWRNIMREFSEELLGNPEHDGDGRPASYDSEVFATLDQARQQGRIHVYCLGIAFDALTLVGEILTVLVIDAEVFDHLAGDFVDRNDEGHLVNLSIPFTQEAIDKVLKDRIAPAGAGCLHLAWQHRDRILALDGISSQRSTI